MVWTKPRVVVTTIGFRGLQADEQAVEPDLLSKCVYRTDCAYIARGLLLPQELLLIRHAVTDMAGTLCGQADPPLNATGRAQANALARSLQGWSVSRLYTSDLQRALQTAQPLAQLWKIPIVARADLREISFGAWEGKRWSEIHSSGPDIRAMESLPEWAAPDGEAFASFRNRVRRAMREVLAAPGGERTAIVAHLGVIRVLLSDLDPTNSTWDSGQRIDYCAVYRILISGESSELLNLHT